MVVTAFVGGVFLISLVNAVFRKDEIVRGLFAIPCMICFSGVFALMTYGDIADGVRMAKKDVPPVERRLPPESGLEAAMSDMLIADYRKALVKEIQHAGRD